MHSVLYFISQWAVANKEQFTIRRSLMERRENIQQRHMVFFMNHSPDMSDNGYIFKLPLVSNSLAYMLGICKL